MRICLIRHGATAGNLERRYIGRTDEPLSPKGGAALYLRDLPEVSLVYVSPLLRARQSAEILFPLAEQRVLDDLREMDFGAFEGRTAEEMAGDAAYRAWVDGMCLGRCPGGESQMEFRARVCDCFRTLAAEEPFAIVAHGGTIMALMAKFARPARDYWQWRVPCGGGYGANLQKDRTMTEPRSLL